MERFSIVISSLNIFSIFKYNGEQAVKEEFPDAVIIRPSNIYGEGDRFLLYYANELRRGINSIALWNKGEMTIKMPVHVNCFCVVPP